MAKSANPGELRTQITIMHHTQTTDADGFTVKDWVNVFGDNIAVGCKWVNVHGTDVLTAMAINLKEPATLTMRYSPKITPTCIIYRKGDAEPYEIISIDNVENRNTWLEIKVQRKAAAK